MGQFEETANLADFNAGTSDSDVTITAGQWVQVAYQQIPAQQAKAFGVGIATPQGADTRETCTIKLYDNNGVQITVGKLRLRVADANENREETVAQGLLSEWSSGKKLGYTGGIATAREDDLLKIEVYLSTNTTFDASQASNTATIPLTVFTRR